jgi:MoxR-like ATPase
MANGTAQGSLDEVNRADRKVLVAIYNLLLAG